MLTSAQIAYCRRLLSEYNAREVESACGTGTGRGRIVRYWPDIPKPMHGPVQEFLGNYVSVANYEVVRITGDPSIPGVLGDYRFNHTMANGQPVRTNGAFFLKAVHYEAEQNKWLWAVLDGNDFILFLTDLASDYIAHWADDEDEWKDEWAFEDEQGVLESAADLPDVPEFDGQTLTMDAAEDHLMVNEYGWIVNDDGATYTVTGSIALEAVVLADAAYGVVKTPFVDGTPRSGTWSGGEVKLVKTDGKSGPEGSAWVVQQELFVEPSAYLLVGRKVLADATEDTRLYQGVAEGQVSEQVEALAQLGNYAVVEVDARKTSRSGMFDLYISTLTVNNGSNYIVVDQDEDPYSFSETRKYSYVKESEVTAFINSITQLGNYARVGSDARETKYAGVYHVYLTVKTINAAANAVLIGGQGGLFATNLYLIKRVKESNMAAMVTALKAQPLIENVRGTRTRDDGYYDIFYSLLIVPAARVEREKGYDRRHQDWALASYKYVDDYTRVITGFDGDAPEYGYEAYKRRLPIGYSEGTTRQNRENSTVKTISYSENNPGDIAAAFAGDTSTGGKTRQLPNGLWEKMVLVQAYAWWW